MAGGRVPQADETRNKLDIDVIGNKADAAVTAKSSTASLVAYAKRLIDLSVPVEATGEADVDISESDYTDYIELLKIEPAASLGLLDLAIELDWNKATTGFDTVATAADTLDVCVQAKTDGTNWRTIATGTQVTANGDGSLEAHESGQRFHIGPIGPGGDVRVLVKVSAERDDFEVPYRVIYRGSAPTITAVEAA